MNEIYKKLHSIKFEIGNVSKDSRNEFQNYNYADLNSIKAVCDPLLSSHSLLFDFVSIVIVDDYYKCTMNVVDVESEEILEKIYDIKFATNSDPVKSCGATMTYAQKYIYGLLLGFKFEDDPDSNDAKKTSVNKTVDKQWLNKWSDKEHRNENPKYWELINRAKEQGRTISDIMKHYKLSKEIKTEVEHDLKN